MKEIVRGHAKTISLQAPRNLLNLHLQLTSTDNFTGSSFAEQYTHCLYRHNIDLHVNTVNKTGMVISLLVIKPFTS